MMWGIGPWIGGYLQVYFDWKAGFFLPETHLYRHPFRLKKIGQDFRMMIQHKKFVGAILAMSFLLGTFICRKLLQHEQEKLIYLLGLSLSLGLSILGILCAYFMGESVYIALIINLSLFLCCGLFNPAVTGFGMTLLFPEQVGSSSAIMYFVNLMITSTVAWSLSFINSTHILPLMYVDFSLMLSCALAYFFMIGPGR